MTHLLTSAQMRALEQAAISSGHTTGLELMERAGTGLVQACLQAWPKLLDGAHRAVVLCGPGNNGGDGFVVARLLQQRGWQVQVYFYGEPAKLPPDARVNHDLWAALGPVESFPATRPDPWAADLIVDAGFGTGLSRPLEDDLIAAFLGCAPESDLKRPNKPPHVVAVDIPTGISADTGALLPAALSADLSVTFHRPKLGHVLNHGPEFCGKLAVVDIGLPQNDQVGGRDVSPVSPVRFVQGCTGPVAKFSGHKFSHGHALVLSGGSGRTGAARLAARGALRIGAGLVTLGVPGSALFEVSAHVTAIMVQRIDDAEAFAAVLEDSRVTALCLGPGMGIKRAKALVPVALKADHHPKVVLDADALTAWADAPESLFEQLHEDCVITPHGGEFARLFPDINARLQDDGQRYSKLDATRDAAQRAGCVVLFKGPDTVIAHPRGFASVNGAAYDRAVPWLATAGAGDVLAGFIAGLLARGIDPLPAAETAAWLHVECARRFGPGLIAEDLPETLPEVLRSLDMQN